MKNEETTNRASIQVVLGILVIAMGVLFLLDNLNILDFRGALRFWPMVFIVVGAAKMTDTKSSNGYALGAILIFIGLAMTLNRMGFLYFSWRTLWPLLLILLGGAVLYKAITGRRLIERSSKLDPASDVLNDTVDITAILGGIERRLTTASFRGGEITAMFGGVAVDMRECSMEGEAVINVFTVCGGITIKVPPDWTVTLLGTPIMGGFEEKTILPKTTGKRLIVKGYAIMGGVEIRN